MMAYPLTFLSAGLPSYSLSLSIFYLPRLPSGSGEAITDTSGYTAYDPVDSRIRKCGRNLW